MTSRRSKTNLRAFNFFSEYDNAGLPAEVAMKLSSTDLAVKKLNYLLKVAHDLSHGDFIEGVPPNVDIEMLHIRELVLAEISKIGPTTDVDLLLRGIEIGNAMQRTVTIQMAASGLRGLIKPKSDGGNSAKIANSKKAKEKIEKVISKWEKLSNKPVRERAGIIANQMGEKPNTVRSWIRKAGLR